MRIHAVGKLSWCCLSLGSQLPKYCDEMTSGRSSYFLFYCFIFVLNRFLNMLRTHFLTELAAVGHRKQRDGHGPLPSGWVLLILGCASCLSKSCTKMDRVYIWISPFQLEVTGYPVPENGYTVVRCFLWDPHSEEEDLQLQATVRWLSRTVLKENRHKAVLFQSHKIHTAKYICTVIRLENSYSGGRAAGEARGRDFWQLSVLEPSATCMGVVGM